MKRLILSLVVLAIAAMPAAAQTDSVLVKTSDTSTPVNRMVATTSTAVGNLATVRVELSRFQLGSNAVLNIGDYNPPLPSTRDFRYSAGNLYYYNGAAWMQLLSSSSSPVEAVLLSPASSQTDSNANASIFINDTGGGNLLHLQSGAVNRFVVGNTGIVTTGTWNGTLINAAYGGTGINTSASTGVPSISAGTWSVSASLGVGLGGTGLTSTPANGQLLIGNGTNYTLATLTEATAFEVAVTNGAGSITLGYDFSATLAGNPALTASRTAFASTGIIFEGSTANTSEGLLTAANPTADRTWTLPDATGTVLVDTTADTTYFKQGGNSFGAAAVLGTNDATSLSFETGGVTRTTIASGGDTTNYYDLYMDTGDQIDFFDEVGEKVALYGAPSVATSYVLGIEGSTLYARANGFHRWYISELADAGTSENMELDVDSLNFNNKEAIRYSDTWLRLNQAGGFASGTYTPGLFRADGGFDVDGLQVIDADAGWHRTYGSTGWYNGTWDGGWYMTDATYIRSYASKLVYVSVNNVSTSGAIWGDNANTSIATAVKGLRGRAGTSALVYADNAGAHAVGIESGIDGYASGAGSPYSGGYFEYSALAYAYVGANMPTDRKIEGAGSVSTTMVTSSRGRVTLQCPETPEAWFEDVGIARLEKGRARVSIDPTFLECVTIDEKHPYVVFVQPDSDIANTVVVKKEPGSFEIIELGGGTSSGEIFWRVMAKWKGQEDIRFASGAGPKRTLDDPDGIRDLITHHLGLTDKVPDELLDSVYGRDAAVRRAPAEQRDPSKECKVRFNSRGAALFEDVKKRLGATGALK